ncbi:GatB/Yqey [gamma proteobacterium HTCC5015]|nr:GatB/Yqey [gamma proteobacterium HTCC5015]
MKATMKGGDRPRLAVIRQIQAAIKQVEVDERRDLSDEDILAVLDKMGKQRREAIEQYDAAGRDDLAEQERFELTVLQDFLPQPLSEEEVKALIQEAIDATGAESMRDMGKVMGQIKPKMQGRADMSQVSAQVKSLLG